MSSELVEKIANAVLYEGYMLYPYRPSAVKNRQRWNFGSLAPEEFMQTECLALGGPESVLRCQSEISTDAGARGHSLERRG